MHRGKERKAVAEERQPRRRAGEALRYSNAILKASLESTADGILAVDNAGRIILFNRKFLDLWHIPAEIASSGDDNRVLSHALCQVKNPDSFIKKIRELYADPVTESFDSIELLDGRIFERYSIPLKIERRSTGRVLSFRDASDRRKLEAQLVQSRKIEAVGRLAGGIAHDFNNLLTAINGYADLLVKQMAIDHPMRREMEEIRKAGERAASLTRQLLAFSRRQILQPRVLDLNSVVSRIDNMLHRLIGEDVTLQTSFGENLWRVKADPGQLDQVLMNLAVNSRDAMPGGGKITIETRNVEHSEVLPLGTGEMPPGAYVMLSVSDTGCGMDEETQSHIFEPFFTTKEQGKGTGLGLAMVYGIVKQGGGYIKVDSEAGKGTTFRIYFPRSQEEPRPSTPEVSSSAPSTGKETVLVVEDQEEVRSLVEEIL
ncbi:MAG TPA: ATP-binding protein, partial [Candidatus Limnocylindrales bacterium]|nr:ATP-binding protein [Candidatus Limnocylindrales bacterium]